MKLFVNSDNTLDVVAQDSLNPANLPIVEVSKLPAPIHYCYAVKNDSGYSIGVKENWREEEAVQAPREFRKQIDILLDTRMAELMKPDFKSRAEVYAFANIEGPLQEKAKELVSRFNAYIQLSHDALESEISMQSLCEFRDLIYSE